MQEDNPNNADQSQEGTLIPLDDLGRLEATSLPRQVNAVLNTEKTPRDAAYAIIDLLHEDPRDMQEWAPPQQHIYLLALAGSIASEDALIQTVESNGPWMAYLYNAVVEIRATTAVAILDRIKAILPGGTFPADEALGREIFASLTSDQQGDLMSLEFAFQDYVADQLPLDVERYARATVTDWV